jgi:hypothetical protein
VGDVGRGDVELGIAIAVRSVLLLFHLSLADECMRFASAAMEALVRLGPVDPKLEFELNIVAWLLLTHTRGDRPRTQRCARACARDRERNEAILEKLALAYCANWVGAFMRSDPRAMFAFAQQFETLTAEDTDPATRSSTTG